MRGQRLSLIQSIRRRFALSGGSYTLPDGHIELDFEEPAGIDRRNDDLALQQAKLADYEERQARGQRDGLVFSAGMVAGLAFAWFIPSLPTLFPDVHWAVKAGLGVVAWIGVLALFWSVRLLWLGVRDYARGN